MSEVKSNRAWRLECEALRAERDRLAKENDFLRALTGNSDKACVYCGLGADEQGMCERGFPGCARADDQMLCLEVGVAMERDQYAKELAEAVEFVQRLRGCIPHDHDVLADEVDAFLARLPPDSAPASIEAPFAD